MYSPEYFYQEIKKLRAKNPSYNENKDDSFSSERADRVAATVLAVLSNMTICGRFTTEINEKLAQKIDSINIFIPERYDNLHSINLPQPEEDELKYALELVSNLEEILLSKEQEHGINLGLSIDKIPEFIMQVPESYADLLILNNYLWKDYNGDPTGFVHSPLAHRIQNYILLRALEERCVDTKILDGYVDLNKQGTILKYLLPTVTKYSFVFPIDSFKFQKRSHWNITMDNDPHKSYNCLPCLPQQTMEKTAHLAGPTRVLEYSLSPVSFEERPHFAQAMYSSCFKELRIIAGFQAKSVLDTFKQYVVGHNQEQFSDPSIHLAISEAVSQKAQKATRLMQQRPVYVVNEPKIKKPDLEHAKRKHVKATETFKKNEFQAAAKRFYKAADEFEQLNNFEHTATSLYSAGSAEKRQGSFEKAASLYNIAYHIRLSLFGSNNQSTQGAKNALDNMLEEQRKLTN